MKKVIAVALILAISLVVITGCTTSTVDESQPPALPEENVQGAQEGEQSEGDEVIQPPALPEG